MKVGDIMSRRIVAAGSDDSVEHLQELFKQHRFHHLLVTSGETLFGVISDRANGYRLSLAAGRVVP